MNKIITAFIAIIAITLIGGMGYMGYYNHSKTEVESYIVGCEISHLSYSEQQISRSQSIPTYKMAVRNDDFAVTLDISATQYAKYDEDEIVDIEVRVFEYLDGYTETTYNLIE